MRGIVFTIQYCNEEKEDRVNKVGLIASEHDIWGGLSKNSLSLFASQVLIEIVCP